MDRQHIIRHPYGNCNKNLTINELYHAGIPYYPIFAYSFGFSFDPGRDSLLGNAVSTYYEPLSYVYEIDPIYQVYGIESYIEDKDEDKDAFCEKLSRLLEISNVACQMDAYYDPSTAYNGLYQTMYTKGHGRIITAMDEDFVYYYTTHKDDPVNRFGISRDDMFLACECLVRFRYPKVLNDRAMRQAVLQKILCQWFVDVDYRKMFEVNVLKRKTAYAFKKYLICAVEDAVYDFYSNQAHWLKEEQDKTLGYMRKVIPEAMELLMNQIALTGGILIVIISGCLYGSFINLYVLVTVGFLVGWNVCAQELFLDTGIHTIVLKSLSSSYQNFK